MRTTKFLLISALLYCCGSLASPSADIRSTWQDVPGNLAKSALPGAGFSFYYGGEPFDPNPPGEWTRVDSKPERDGRVSLTLQHESGLVVRREMQAYPTLGAAEYKLYFKNTAKEALPALSAIHALNVSFAGPLAEGACVISGGGAFPDLAYPPSSYAIREKCFPPSNSATVGGLIPLGAESGRSSSKELPFFFVHNDTKQEGMFVAAGWSGQWGALVSHDPTRGSINIRVKIPDLNISLRPGEEIQGPTVLIGFYQGALANGSNHLRRVVRDFYTPKLAGKQFAPVATYDTWWHIWTDYDEGLVRTLADTASRLGQEYFLLDAGWYRGTTTGEAGFSAGLGNWFDVDRTKLPHGIKPVADYVRSKGLKFGLFFEPERVAPGSALAQAHPDWILWARTGDQWRYGTEREWKRWINEISGPDWNDGNSGLLDYGRPDVQVWVRNMLDQNIRDYGIKYIRYDFNIDPLPYWSAKDVPGRQGVAQLRHIQGLYSIVDWIRERHPDTVLEGCSSGGQRIDLETARRFHTFWISDSTYDPTVVRYHLFGLNYFLPGNYHYAAYTLPLPRQQDFTPDNMGFQSFFGGAFGLSGRIDRWSVAMQQLALQHVEAWKQKLRRYLIEDYYPLTPQPANAKAWSGWQYHDPLDQSGFIQTFRPENRQPTYRFHIQGLDGTSLYQFTDLYGTDAFAMTGSKAMTEGIEITQQTMSSKVLTYRRSVGASTTSNVTTGSLRSHAD